MLFPLLAEADVVVVVVVVVVFVLPGAEVLLLLPCAAGTVVALTLPGAVALFPCSAAGVVSVCPRAAANAFAVNAGRRSDAEGWTGFGSLVSAGSPRAGCNAWVKGIPGTGTKPSPPRTITNSQPRNTKNTRRPARRSQRARFPVGSSKTADPPRATVGSGIPNSRAGLPRRHSLASTKAQEPRATALLAQMVEHLPTQKRRPGVSTIAQTTGA